MCGIANCGPDSDGFIFIGVADKKHDADRVFELDGVEPNQINNRYVLGIDRELKIDGIDMDNYINKILTSIRSSQLTEPLKSQIL
jgi:predicted HTH transcriptional regulator